VSSGFESRKALTRSNSARSDSARSVSPQSQLGLSASRKVFGTAAAMSDSSTSGTGSQGHGPQGSGSQDNDRSTTSAGRNREEHLQWVLQQVRQALTGLKFGQITITVQDGLAIQIERTEKTRLR